MLGTVSSHHTPQSLNNQAGGAGYSSGSSFWPQDIRGSLKEEAGGRQSSQL